MWVKKNKKKSSTSEQSSRRIIRYSQLIAHQHQSKPINAHVGRSATRPAFVSTQSTNIEMRFCGSYFVCLMCAHLQTSRLSFTNCVVFTCFHQNNTASATRIELDRTYPFTTEKYMKHIEQCLHNLQLCAKCMILRARLLVPSAVDHLICERSTCYAQPSPPLWPSLLHAIHKRIKHQSCRPAIDVYVYWVFC